MMHTVPVEALIPHRRQMKLLDRVLNPAHKEFQAEATITDSWPLARDGAVSSLLCIELMAQAVSALSTWRKGEGARPRPGLLVGVKEAEFLAASLQVGTRVKIHVEELYHVGNYGVFTGQVTSGCTLLCTASLQVMEPEEEGFLYFRKARGAHATGKQMGG